MTKKHQAELTAVAEKIYDLAANEIQTYINKTYGKNQENTLAQQLEDFHVIADTASSYLMGNAMATGIGAGAAAAQAVKKGIEVRAVDATKLGLFDNPAK